MSWNTLKVAFCQTTCIAIVMPGTLSLCTYISIQEGLNYKEAHILLGMLKAFLSRFFVNVLMKQSSLAALKHRASGFSFCPTNSVHSPDISCSFGNMLRLLSVSKDNQLPSGRFTGSSKQQYSVSQNTEYERGKWKPIRNLKSPHFIFSVFF